MVPLTCTELLYYAKYVNLNHSVRLCSKKNNDFLEWEINFHTEKRRRHFAMLIDVRELIDWERSMGGQVSTSCSLLLQAFTERGQINNSMKRGENLSKFRNELSPGARGAVVKMKPTIVHKSPSSFIFSIPSSSESTFISSKHEFSDFSKYLY